jgi:hypothetical protein
MDRLLPDMNLIIPLSKSIESVITQKCLLAAGGRGLKVTTDLHYEEWATLVSELSRIQDSYQFMIGDLIAYGETRYEPGRYMRAAEMTGRQFQTIHQWASACRSIPPERRKFKLKWTHYYEVAFDLSPEQQDRLLTEAESNKWAAPRLREEVRLCKAGYHEFDSNSGEVSLSNSIISKPLNSKRRKIQPGEVFGPRIGTKAMPFGPTNEMGVVALFAILAEKLGFSIELVRVRFPDCLAKRNIGGKWEHCEIEFEFRSSDFEKHGHNPNNCDLIVCWINDWENCPIPVLALQDCFNP